MQCSSFASSFFTLSQLQTQYTEEQQLASFAQGYVSGRSWRIVSIVSVSFQASLWSWILKVLFFLKKEIPTLDSGNACIGNICSQYLVIFCLLDRHTASRCGCIFLFIMICRCCYIAVCVKFTDWGESVKTCTAGIQQSIPSVCLFFPVCLYISFTGFSFCHHSSGQTIIIRIEGVQGLNENLVQIMYFLRIWVSSKYNVSISALMMTTLTPKKK